MRTMHTDIFKYEELDDRAKERAREWWCEGALDYDWWEYRYEWLETICNAIGITIDDKHGTTCGGKTFRSPAIYFTGFSSQGDGACFSGSYEYKPGWRKALAGECNDPDVLEVAETLAALQKKHNYQLSAKVRQSGRYCHEYTMQIDSCDRTDGKQMRDVSDTYEAVLECFRDLARWLYSGLEKEYDWQLEDKQAEESIISNGYEFTEDGHIA